MFRCAEVSLNGARPAFYPPVYAKPNYQLKAPAPKTVLVIFGFQMSTLTNCQASLWSNTVNRWTLPILQCSHTAWRHLILKNWESGSVHWGKLWLQISHIHSLTTFHGLTLPWLCLTSEQYREMGHKRHCNHTLLTTTGHNFTEWPAIRTNRENLPRCNISPCRWMLLLGNGTDCCCNEQSMTQNLTGQDDIGNIPDNGIFCQG